MALDATPGGPASNAYVDVAGATALLDERLNTQPWYAPPQDVTLQAQREAALITATRLLDEQFIWRGTPTMSTQALGWPRTAVQDPQRRPVDPARVPDVVQRATAYYALALLRDTSESPTAVAAGTIKRQVLGETSIEYFQPGSTTTTRLLPPATTVPTEIRQMLQGYGLVHGGVMVPLIRT